MNLERLTRRGPLPPRNPDSRWLHENIRRVAGRLNVVLDAREAKVVRSRFGLDGQPPMRLQSIAFQVLGGYTKERAAQLLVGAAEKLRADFISRSGASPLSPSRSASRQQAR